MRSRYLIIKTLLYEIQVALALDSVFSLPSNDIHIRVERFDQCTIKPDLKNQFVDSVISQTGYKQFQLSGTILLREQINPPVTLQCKLYKCASKQEPGTCEYYYTYKTDQFCQALGQKNMTWTPFIEATNLPESCPIKKGEYKINGAKFDLTSMYSIPMLVGYFKVTCTGINQKKIYFCVDTEIDVSKANRRPG